MTFLRAKTNNEKKYLNSLILTDVKKPTIICPDDIVASTINVTWPDPDVNDNIDTIPAVLCDHSTNFTFPVGETTVSCSATDDAGNSATCTFNVTVGMYSKQVQLVNLNVFRAGIL